MKNVQMYTKDFCAYCSAAKNFFVSKEIKFEEINLSQDLDQLRALIEKTQFRTVPQIFIGDEFIGGYTELMALEESGELEAKLH